MTINISRRKPSRLALTITLVLMSVLSSMAFGGRQVAHAATIIEGFDSGVPAGWTTTNQSEPLGAAVWTQCNGAVPIGFIGGAGSCVTVNYQSTLGTGTISNWLISPLITNVKNGDIFTFYTRSGGTSNPDRLQVLLSINGTCNPGTGSASTGDFTNLLIDIDPSYLAGEYPFAWTGYTFTVSGLAVPVDGCIGFRYFVENGGPSGVNSDSIGIDEFRYIDSGLGTATASPTPSRTPTPGPTATVGASATNTTVPTATNTPLPTNTQLPLIPDTIGAYNNGTYYLRNTNSAGAADLTVTFGGLAGDIGVAGDWNGDGQDTIGFYRGTQGVFVLSNSNATPALDIIFVFGDPGDSPLVGRWDNTMTGDGVGVFRASNGLFFLKKQLTSGFDDVFFLLGSPGDKPVAGDWEANGFDSAGIYRPSDSSWYLSNNSTPSSILIFADIAYPWDIGSNTPIVGDWDGNGTSTAGFLTSDGNFSLHPNNSAGGTDNTFAFGPTGSQPLAGKWLIVPRPPLLRAAGDPSNIYINAPGGNGSGD